MPKGYVIVTEEITDQAQFERYGEKAVPTIMQYNGQILVVHDKQKCLRASGTVPAPLCWSLILSSRRTRGTTRRSTRP